MTIGALVFFNLCSGSSYRSGWSSPDSERFIWNRLRVIALLQLQIWMILCFVWNYACEHIELPLACKMSLCKLEKALLLGRQIRKKGCLVMHLCVSHKLLNSTQQPCEHVWMGLFFLFSFFEKKFSLEVTEAEVIHRRNRPRKWGTEGKKGPLELRRESEGEGQRDTLRERQKGGNAQATLGKRERACK